MDLKKPILVGLARIRRRSAEVKDQILRTRRILILRVG
jgi:hypothetical protein